MIGNFLDEDDAIDLAKLRPTKIWAPEVAYLERRAKIILEIGIGGFRTSRQQLRKLLTPANSGIGNRAANDVREGTAARDRKGLRYFPTL